MPCYSPIRALLVDGPDGRRLSFSSVGPGKGISLPCGRCIGCRLERARQWAVRIMHEAKMHEDNSFITLTYDRERLPENGTLVVRDCQLFLKRLRKEFIKSRIKFFLCGEYGDKGGRPHYHAILFGVDFPDKKLIEETERGRRYTSDLLSSIWGMGRTEVGEVSFESAMYVANYATKKVVGKGADAHYQGRKPEFLLMSRGGRKAGGIGRSWIEKFVSDVYPRDEVIVRGKQARPPRYYDQFAEKNFPQLLESIKAKRESEAGQLEDFVFPSGHTARIAPSCNVYRLKVRETVARAKLALKRRKLENEK